MARGRAVKVTWIVLQALLWAVVAGFLALLAVPRVSRFEIFIVRSGSMEPTIRTGGVVLVDTRARELRVGQVGSFRDGKGDIVTHRVVALRDGGYVTRGDANRTDDSTLRRPADVVGAERWTLPYLGYALYLLERPFIFILLLGSTGGYLVISELAAIWREIKNLRRSDETAP
ncbi:MAG: signal peptidase I [Dehalococcoidia bacterium]|nr:signal peptidase I [Dehalococcoidia bacterium]